MKQVFVDFNEAEHMPGFGAYRLTASPLDKTDTFQLGEEVQAEDSDFFLKATVSGLMDRGRGFFLEVMIAEEVFD